jgi:glutamate-1-semialdehyde 2,1-aminomutase
MELNQFTRSYEMFERAKKVVPGGLIGPRTPLFLTYGSHPVFSDRSQGARFWDVDGNEFIDYMCGFGAQLLGYRHPVVEEAARRQAEKGDCFTMPSERWLEFAEFVVAEIPMADWCVFAKNGSDVTSYAALVARVAAGRPGIALAHHAYHGLDHWCLESNAGIPPEYKSHVYRFRYNDLEDLEDLVRRQPNEIAGVFLTPVGHWAMTDQEEPVPGYFEAVRRLCDREGMLFLMDDIRCGFRFRYEGSHAYYGQAEPDLICFGKAMANGHPISMMAGKARFMDAARQVYFSGTHFFSAVPMAAAMACMREIKASGAIARIKDLGRRFQAGLRDQAKAHGLPASVTGHPAMPYLTFADDPTREKNRFFCGEAAKRGIFLHPHHNWFVSAALTDAELSRTLEVTDLCFKLLAEKR